MATTNTTNIGGRLQKERVSVSKGTWKLLLFMAFVFGVTVLSYLGLLLGYRPYVRAQIDNADQTLQSLAQQVPKEQQDAYLKFQYQLRNLQTVLSSHVIMSKLSPILRATINQRVFYKNLTVDVASGRVDFQASAPTYEVLAQQLASYQARQDIVNYHMRNSGLAEGNRIIFEVSLFLDPNIFRQ
ncbi:MAG: hypothetical protein COU07_01650 [Candidatus Harrisonbacteria bacterium CG10_big_fil_rev_8_21_14_0_10_40_38]|uniref:Transmembrane protein n=1 Tax=Candidatus Harrisonbacteria bacterium CG10_big_fil_rev_8_21_14_0_10_40_38 TaxID=1974583 RepID=A0A2H0UT36_9BACT|nr:MAG: hypothetical protein COU07_01650 [Candidatus Harrisonbacteria bacterium CG10_big_fil_rev_8_21_14_0_10_40_38]